MQTSARIFNPDSTKYPSGRLGGDFLGNRNVVRNQPGAKKLYKKVSNLVWIAELKDSKNSMNHKLE